MITCERPQLTHDRDFSILLPRKENYYHSVTTEGIHGFFPHRSQYFDPDLWVYWMAPYHSRRTQSLLERNSMGNTDIVYAHDTNLHSPTNLRVQRFLE